MGDLAEQRLARKRRLLEAHGNRDRRPRRKRLVGSSIAGEHLARADPGSDLKHEPVITLEIGIQDEQSLPQVVSSPHGPKGVVLVHLRHAEHRHSRVADELLDRPAVPLDDRPDGVEVAPHDAPQDLRVECGMKARGVDDVGEEHGDGLAPLLA